MNFDLEGDLIGHRYMSHWSLNINLPPDVDYWNPLIFKFRNYMVFLVWPWTVTLKVTSEVIAIGVIEIATSIYPKLHIFSDITYRNYGLPGPYIHNITYRNFGRPNIKFVADWMSYQNLKSSTIGYQNFKNVDIVYFLQWSVFPFRPPFTALNLLAIHHVFRLKTWNPLNS